MTNADLKEVRKFSDLAHRWWDPNSEFKALHDINPLRLEFIRQRASLAGVRALDVGCGGGLLSEGLAAGGAEVTGIDLSDEALTVARLHLLESGTRVEYRKISVEALAAEQQETFDVVTCLEMLEHVPDPASVVRSCAQLAKPGANLFFSTINRNARAYALAVIGAEYVLRLLPKGTHDYAKFIKPSELVRWCSASGLDLAEIVGMSYNPLTKVYSLDSDPGVNYLIHVVKRD